MTNLFSEFGELTVEQWKAQIEKELKGVSFEQLKWKSHNGFEVKPFYTIKDLAYPSSVVFKDANWESCENITVRDEVAANAQALSALQKGASGLVFTINQKINTSALLNGIAVENIYTQFDINQNAIHVLEDLKANYAKFNSYDGKVKCFVNIDPLHLLANSGNWYSNLDEDISIIKSLKHICVNIGLYEEAGANTVNELSIGLAHLNEYLNYLLEAEDLEKKIIHLTVSIGPDFFTEIAKLRALRKLVANLQEHYQTNFDLHIHAKTALIDKSFLDVYTNLLRTTTEAMSAAIGGADSISVLPYNEAFDETSEFASRIAINQQHILKDESYLNKVADISAGSYFVESLTDLIAQEAWEKFKFIESEGGFIQGILNNTIQDRIAQDAKILQEQFEEKKLVLVGVNKFQNKNEESSLKWSHAEIKTPASITRAIRPFRIAEQLENQQDKVK